MSAEAELVVALERELAKVARRLANATADTLLRSINPDDGERRHERAFAQLTGSYVAQAELFRLVEYYHALMVRYQTALRSLPAVPTVGGQ